MELPLCTTLCTHIDKLQKRCVLGHNKYPYYEMDEQDTDLIISTAKGDVDRVKELLETGCNINEQNSKGNSAIVLAVQMDSMECVKILLDYKADVNIVNEDGDTPLLETIWCSGSIDIVKMLISAGAELDIKSSDELTALHTAVIVDEPTIIRELLLGGANLSIGDRSGRTPILLAAQTGHIKCMDTLFAFGADVNDRDINYDTGLILAVGFDLYGAVMGDFDTSRAQCIDRLIDQGIDVNAANYQHETALFVLSQQWASDYTLTTVKKLFRAGAEINKNVPETDLNCIKACYEANRNDKNHYYLSVLKLFFIAGEKCAVAHKNEVNKALGTSARVISNGSLFHLCRGAIRSILVQRHRTNLFETVPMLPLPRSIISFLLYDEEL